MTSIHIRTVSTSPNKKLLLKVKIEAYNIPTSNNIYFTLFALLFLKNGQLWVINLMETKKSRHKTIA